MGKYYDNSIIPTSLKRNFDVYDRVEKLGINLGNFEDNVTDLTGAGIAGIVFHESGLVYLSGLGLGPGNMYDDPDRIQKGHAHLLDRSGIDHVLASGEPRRDGVRRGRAGAGDIAAGREAPCARTEQRADETADAAA